MIVVTCKYFQTGDLRSFAEGPLRQLRCPEPASAVWVRGAWIIGVVPTLRAFASS